MSKKQFILLLEASENLSNILHQLEQAGVELTRAQNLVWKRFTIIRESIRSTMRENHGTTE